VVAEGLILLAFAGSSLDVSIGGKLAGISWLAVGWGIVFALGIDTSFILSWVRVRQLAMELGKRRHLWWAIPLAAGMSFIVFQPVAIQQLQQSMGISFSAALANLGIDLNFLVYARSGVAVLLGAVLAMTNVESPVNTKNSQKITADIQVETSGYEMETGGNHMEVIEEQKEATVFIPETSISTRDQVKAAYNKSATNGDKVNIQKIALETGVPYSTARRHIQAIEEPEKLRLTREATSENPSITDEELARLLGINRPAAARFWRLKAKEAGNEEDIPVGTEE